MSRYLISNTSNSVVYWYHILMNKYLFNVHVVKCDKRLKSSKYFSHIVTENKLKSNYNHGFVLFTKYLHSHKTGGAIYLLYRTLLSEKNAPEVSGKY